MASAMATGRAGQLNHGSTIFAQAVVGADFAMQAEWRKSLLVCRAEGDAIVPDVSITREDQLPVRSDLLELFDISELEKYFIDDELAEHPSRTT